MANEPEAGELLPPGCGLWLGWIITSIIGSASGWALGWWASMIAPGMISTAIIGSTMGIFLGSMQWLVIRGIVDRSGWWPLASVFGWGAGFSIGVEIAQRLGLSDIMFGLVVGVLIGTLLGLSQWVVLHRQVTKAGWWIPASTFAWASSLIYYRPGITGVGAVYGILSGIVTGIVLLWLFYRPVPDYKVEIDA